MSKKRAVDSESPLENESAKKRMVTMVWWKDKQRRQPTHDTRAPPTFKTTSAVTVSEHTRLVLKTGTHLLSGTHLLRTMSIMHN